MPIPTRSGSVKVNRDAGSHNLTTSTSLTSKVVQSSSHENKASTTSEHGNISSRLIRPKPAFSHPTIQNASATKKPSGLARSASTTSKPKPSNPPTASRLNTPTVPDQASHTAIGRGHVRQQSVTVTKPRSPPPGHSRAASTAASQNAKADITSKPSEKTNFNTFQQNFSPRKPRVPSTTKNSDVKPLERGNSTTITQHQLLLDELLQLQLVHKDSAISLRNFRASVDRQISDLQENVYRKRASVAEAERQHQRLLSLEALDDWLKSVHAYSDDQQIQLLGRTIDQIRRLEESLCSPDGNLTIFATWQGRALEVLTERESTTSSNELKSIDALGSEWTIALLQAKQNVSASLSCLQELKPKHGNSGIYALISGHIKLGESLVEEIETALQMEKTIMEQEHNWLSREIEAALNDDSLNIGNSVQPIWRRA